MANYTGSAVASILFSTAVATAAAVASGSDATGYVAAVAGSGTIASPGWSPITTARTGSALKSPADDWYSRLYWQPQGTIDAGALLGPESYSLAVWNGNTASITLTSITPTNAAGVTTDGTPGETIGGLVSRTFTITFTPTGDRSELAGSLTFLFSTGFSFVVPVAATEYGVWLSYENAQRCVLVEAQRYGPPTVTAYLSNLGYVSRPTDTPAHQGYDEALSGSIEIRSRIDGETVIGQIEVDNTEGDRDDWPTLAWEGWPITVLLGDMTWPRDAFRVLASGTIEALEAPSTDRLMFRLADKRSKLDVPLLRTRRTDGQLVPVCLGTCFNVQPILVNAGTLTFRCHDGPLTDVVAVRDRGVACTFTEDLANGKFTKTSTPAAGRGGVTADVIGETDGSVAAIVDWLARKAGLVDADIDSASLLAFPGTAKLGVYVSTERTAAEVLTEVMESVGGAWGFSRAGKLQLWRLEAPGAATLTLDADDVEASGLSVTAIEQPRYAVRVGYRRNYTPQDHGSLAGAVGEDDRDLYGREYSIAEAVSATIKTSYPLAEEPELVPTYIVSQADAQAEADRRLALRGVKRTIYSARCFAAPFSVELGQTISLTYPRYAFTAGATAVVIGMREQPALDRVELDLWR